MKILRCHNFYRQPGGEDITFELESRLLESRGHQVFRYTRHNDELDGMSRWSALRSTLWSRRTVRELGELIRAERPAIMHCTNTFPLISPAAYHVARAAGVRVVQSLHNYRLVCPAATLYRQGGVCEDCLGRRLPWPAALHGCYRSSRAASAATAAMLVLHNARKTWTRAVDRYVAVTRFVRDKLVQGGLEASRIDVKPNFVDPDRGPGTGEGHHAVFVGRLSAEKGVGVLLAAWKLLAGQIRLRIIGDGPLAGVVEQAAAVDERIEWVGWKSPEEVAASLRQASFLVMPSIWYEPFGRAVIESFSAGTPVIASRLGGLEELVDDGRTGLLFVADDAAALAVAIRELHGDRSRLASMRASARAEYEAKYTAGRDYELLMTTYERVLGR